MTIENGYSMNNIHTSKDPWELKKPTAYGGLLMLVLLSKIEETDTFKATNLHQNGVKTYLKVSQL